MSKKVLGIIGGSGLYDIDGLIDPVWHQIDTPWGAPSDQLLTGTLHNRQMVFLPRHGRQHQHAPHQINYRANIDAMKQLGVSDIVSMSACGSFQENFAPGDFVIVDQFVDRTHGRESSFFGTGCVAHVSIAHPVCEQLAKDVYAATTRAGVRVHNGGTYLAMQGPQFSTLAESRLYREVWKCDVIGMTAMPEVKLAREAEICYTTVAMVTDYDSWHPEHGAVDINDILKVMAQNTQKARQVLHELVQPNLLSECTSNCQRALEYAVVTPTAARDPHLVRKLSTVAGRIMGETS